MNEVWKDIKGFEGLYQISNSGRVMSLPKEKLFPTTGQIQRFDKRIMKLNKAGRKREYFQVHINKNNKRHIFYVHRLVATHFCENYFEGAQVNHKDGVKTNNRAENLEWVTASENIKHAYRNNLMPKHKKVKRRKLSQEDAREIIKLRNEKELTYRELGDKFNVASSTINRVMKKEGTGVDGKKS